MWYCAKLAPFISIWLVSKNSGKWCTVILAPCLSGVPQGTVLGPLLFLIYIDDIVLGIDSEIRLFADDCILYRLIRNLCDSAYLESDINNLHEWSHKWQMSLSVSKCCIWSIFRKRTPPALIYTLGNTLLNVVNSHSYLGVTVSSDLLWHEHVNNLRLPKLSTSYVAMCVVVPLIPRLQLTFLWFVHI